MIGRILNDRYQLLEKIGTGGMAIVYLGKDKLLDREVAVKVLQQQFTDNQKAVERFNREAKAVASLSHPNIVNIFDIGHEDDLHYIVMEYIRSSDLKEVLKEKNQLPISKALEIGQGVCRALIKAHRNNIVHCDIKPHNILLTEDNTVKVTDFGIAQAVTDATLTQTNSIIGSAHYLSPEQAEGKRVSTRSDIYSLGVVLYELVTGELPFRADSSVAIALKHVEEEPPSLQDKNPNVSNKLEKIILKALAKEPEERYNSVAEMLRDLKEIATKGIEQGVSHQETMVIAQEELKKEELKREAETEEKNNNLEDDLPVAEEKSDEKQEKGLGFTLGMVGLILTIVLGTGYYFLMDYLTVEEVKVPNIIKRDIKQAKNKLNKHDLRLEVYYKAYNNEIKKNHVVSQSPKPNEVVKKNRVIEVVISKGAKLVKIPKLSNKTLREAKLELDKRELILGQVERTYSKEVPKDHIISQTPQVESNVKSETEVKLVVSKGRKPREVTVPSLVGLRREEGIDKLREKNLILGQVIKKKSLNYLKGRIIAQQPESGNKLLEGSTVKLIISQGIRNPYDAPVKTSKVRTYIPPGKKSEVKIVVKDDNGRRIVYQQTHQPEDKVEQQVVTVGSAVIQVYIDGQLNIEKRI
ncbi:Stk1 family PASTA domain-containing Ser/Thr kinase [Halanaerocella petrolearia]